MSDVSLEIKERVDKNEDIVKQAMSKYLQDENIQRKLADAPKAEVTKKEKQKIDELLRLYN